jgi:hypothetical protein
VYACQKTSPAWTKECLSFAFREVTEGPASVSMAEKAKEIGIKARKDGPGRYVAAAKVAELARLGK